MTPPGRPPGERLSEAARAAALADLAPSGWRLVEGREAIARRFEFASFSQAFGFIARVALLAERMDHHPEWSNVHRRVEIVLTTHAAKGLSARDPAMARAIDALL